MKAPILVSPNTWLLRCARALFACTPVFIGALTLLAVSPTSALAQSGNSDTCTISAPAGATLSEAGALFAANCPGRVRRDCDQIGGRWQCSTAVLGSSAPGIQGADESYSGVQDRASTPDTGSTEATPAVESGLCYSSREATVGQAREAFRSQCSGYTLRDCDPIGSGWTCSSGVLGGSAPAVAGGSGASVQPTDLADADPVRVDTPAESEPAESEPTESEPVESAGIDEEPAEDEPEVVSSTPADVGSVAESASLARIPDQLDNHQRMNLKAVSAGTTYTDGSGQLKQAWAYWSDDRRATVVTRDFPDGQWSLPIDIHNAVTGRSLEYDAHNWLSIGVAPNGALFAAGNMHVDPLQMATSTRAWDWSSLESMPRSRMGSSDTDRVTYPDFFTLRGRLYFIYREQEVGGGRANFRYIVKRYLHENDRWETASVLNSGENLRLYVSKVFVSPDGQRAHLLGVWRDDSSTGASRSQVTNNRDAFHLYSENGSNWQQYGEGTVDLPLWYSNGLSDRGSLVPDNIWDTSRGDPLPANDTGSVVVDAQGVTHALLRARNSGRNYHARYTGNRWVVTQLPWAAGSQTLVTWGGNVGAVLSQSDRVMYASLDPDDSTWSSPRTIVDGLSSSLYWVRQDWTAQRHGYLSIILTETLNERTGQVGSYDRDAHVLTVPLSRLESTRGIMANESGLQGSAFGR